eukprot:gb/GEZN01029238.1/.p1 GENE.gb/GEZN01029238.1/~~gb/GEZN01029238.1/.p1  ORF type:complete len:134 (-),score=13.84 gb/GEZN01029238.1/:67-468(-)
MESAGALQIQTILVAMTTFASDAGLQDIGCCALWKLATDKPQLRNWIKDRAAHALSGQHPLYTDLMQAEAKSKPCVEKRLCVCVVGGGPVGLAFALTLALLQIKPPPMIVVREFRWIREPCGRIRWKNAQEGA